MNERSIQGHLKAFQCQSKECPFSVQQDTTFALSSYDENIDPSSLYFFLIIFIAFFPLYISVLYRVL